MREGRNYHPKGLLKANETGHYLTFTLAVYSEIVMHVNALSESASPDFLLSQILHALDKIILQQLPAIFENKLYVLLEALHE